MNKKFILIILFLSFFINNVYSTPIYHIDFKNNINGNITNAENSLYQLNMSCMKEDNTIENCNILSGYIYDTAINNTKTSYSGTNLEFNSDNGITFVLSFKYYNKGTSTHYSRVIDKNNYYVGYAYNDNGNTGITSFYRLWDNGNDCFSNNFFNIQLENNKEYILIYSIYQQKDYVWLYDENKNLILEQVKDTGQDYGNCDIYHYKTFKFNEIKFESYDAQESIEPFTDFDDFLMYDTFRNGTELNIIEQDINYNSNNNNNNNNQITQTATITDIKELLKYIINNILISDITLTFLIIQIIIGVFIIIRAFFKN